MQFDENTKKHLTERSIWMRLVYMIGFGIIYNMAEVALVVIIVFQFLSKLFTGQLNPQLLNFSHSLSIFLYQIWCFLTFNTEILPFPFLPWPTTPLPSSDARHPTISPPPSDTAGAPTVSLSKEPPKNS